MTPRRQPTAIIDIGSNSVRLVVYGGATRAPSPIFNEKVLAGLGTGLGETGKLAAEPQEVALAALARFRLLLKYMSVGDTSVVATAAVRDAANGPAFVRAIKRIGFDCAVLSAKQEARLAGQGVLSAIPAADGIVGDLGGGSLELVEVAGGAVGHATSLPLGVLRVDQSAAGEREALAILRAALADSGLGKSGRGRPLYMVGGSWRALAKIDMLARHYPLPIMHGYAMTPARAAALRHMVAAPDATFTKGIAAARLATSPVAAMLLQHLAEELRPSALVISSFGIREGLLFDALRGKARGADPLIAAARDTAGTDPRFDRHGKALDAWMGSMFDDGPDMRRLRLAACLFADAAWRVNADQRCERGVEMALHGDWVGVDHGDRVVMAQALSSTFGRNKLPDLALAQLCPPQQLDRARCWGMAMRLGQRLSGGVGAALSATSLGLVSDTVVLRVARAKSALVGASVERRLARFAEALGHQAAVTIG